MSIMCDEVTSSCGLASSDTSDVPSLDTLVESFDPMSCFQSEISNNSSEISNSFSVLPDNPYISLENPNKLPASKINTTVKLNIAASVCSSSLSPSDSLPDFSSTQFCEDPTSDPDMDPFAATVVYSGLSALGDLTNVDSIYNEGNSFCSDERHGSVEIHINNFQPDLAAAKKSQPENPRLETERRNISQLNSKKGRFV